MDDSNQIINIDSGMQFQLRQEASSSKENIQKIALLNIFIVIFTLKTVM